MSTEAKRVCPSCGYEYEDWVEVCPDCNTPVRVQPAKLEVVRGELGDDDDPRWTVVTNVPNAILGSLIKSQLEDAGIPVVMMRSSSADIAHFSHNDYVPHDIRVPFSRVRDARRLIDSPPGGNLVEQDWEDFYAEDDEAVGGGGESGGREERGESEEHRRGLPEGWSVLPTESDIRARQMLRRSMGKPPEDWYWSDSRRKEEVREEEVEEVEEQEQGGSFWEEKHDRSAAGAGSRRRGRGRGSGAYEEEYEDYEPYRNGDPYGPSKWVRWFYAILLLAMSLPFIFQLIETLFSFGQPLP